jgi:hypothetical protein
VLLFFHFYLSSLSLFSCLSSILSSYSIF